MGDAKRKSVVVSVHNQAEAHVARRAVEIQDKVGGRLRAAGGFGTQHSVKLVGALGFGQAVAVIAMSVGYGKRGGCKAQRTGETIDRRRCHERDSLHDLHGSKLKLVLVTLLIFLQGKASVHVLADEADVLLGRLRVGKNDLGKDRVVGWWSGANAKAVMPGSLNHKAGACCLNIGQSSDCAPPS